MRGRGGSKKDSPGSPRAASPFLPLPSPRASVAAAGRGGGSQRKARGEGRGRVGEGCVDGLPRRLFGPFLEGGREGGKEGGRL